MNETTALNATPTSVAFFVPERDYVRLVQYMVHRYGSGGLPRPTYRETADLLSQEVGWIVDPKPLNTAHYRWKKSSLTISIK